MNDKKKFKRLLEEIRWLAEDIRWANVELQGRDFLSTWDRSLKEIQYLLYTADALKWLYENNISLRCFESGTAFLQNRDTSNPVQVPWWAWNRLSFCFAAGALGLTVHHLGKEEGDIEKTFLPFLRDVEFIGIQDTSPGTGEEENQGGSAYMKKMAAGLPVLPGYKKEGEIITHRQRPGVINLQCNLDYPLQAMADLLVLKRHFVLLERLAGKKIALTWVGTSTYPALLSMPQGIVTLASRFGMEVALAHPPGYDLHPLAVETAQKHAQSSGGNFTLYSSLEEAIKDADVVYPLHWVTSNPQDGAVSAAQEKETIGEHWKYTEEKRNLTRRGRAYTMKSRHSMAYKTHLILAMMLNYRFREPVKLLESLKKREAKRLLF